MSRPPPLGTLKSATSSSQRERARASFVTNARSLSASLPTALPMGSYLLIVVLHVFCMCFACCRHSLPLYPLLSDLVPESARSWLRIGLFWLRIGLSCQFRAKTKSKSTAFMCLPTRLLQDDHFTHTHTHTYSRIDGRNAGGKLRQERGRSWETGKQSHLDT